MEITINFIDDSKVILNPVGNVNFSTSKILKDALDEVFNDDYKEIIIDFSEIKNIDSEGLGRLLLFHKKLKDNEG
ncbi:MAG: STAS domain-containing protein, partial [Candidatus Woesearchaeota archaeon]